MFQLKRLTRTAFYDENENLSADKFDLIVKTHRFIGIFYYGFYEKESVLKIITFATFYLFMYAIIVTISSPCLVTQFNCDVQRNNKFDNEFLNINQMMIYFVIRDSIGIASSLIYSLRGKLFRDIINDLRQLFREMNGNKKSFRVLYFCIIIIYFVQIFFTFGFIGSFCKFDVNSSHIYITIIEAIGIWYACLMYLSTDFLIGYFVSYLVIIQKLYSNYLLIYSERSINQIEVQQIKSKFNKIQSIIERLSKIVSPLLFFSLSAIFFVFVNHLYFTAKSYKKTEATNGIHPNYLMNQIGVIYYLIRLFFYCFTCEQLKNQVIN